MNAELPATSPGAVASPVTAPTVWRSASLPPALTEGPNTKDLWHALRRRWVLAFGVGVPCAVGIALVTWFFLVPSRYTASALLHISSVPPRVLSPSGDSSGDFGSYQRTQAAIIKSRFVLNAALRQPKVADLTLVRERLDPAEWLTRDLKVDSALGPEIIRISLSGEHPEELATLVNAITDAYLREVVNKERNTQQMRVDRLKEIYTQYDENLRTRRRTLRKLAETAGSSDQNTLAVKQRYALDQLAMSQRELMDLQSQLRRLQVELATQENKGPVDATLPDSFVEAYLKTDPLGQQLLTRIAELNTAIERTLQVVVRGEQEPAVQRLRAELAEANRQLAERRKELDPQLTKLYRERLERDQLATTNALRERRSVLQDLEKVLSSDVDRLAQQTQSINKQSLDLESLREEINLSENISKQIASEIEHLKVELQAPPRVHLLENAETPRTKEIKRQLTMSGMAGLLALACCLGGLTLLEYRARRIHTVDEVVRGLGLRLVGAVPAMPHRVRGVAAGAISARDLHWQNVLTDSVDAARTMLLHCPGQERHKLVMITSASAGEGKTSVATQLAQSIARAGLRTLLIDGDLRKPDTHRLFGVGCEQGLSEVLRREGDVTRVIQPTSQENLWILPAGCCDDATLATLARPCLKELLADLRERYDFVLIDSAPVLAVADSLLLGRHVDGVVLSTMRYVSRLPAIYEAYERLTNLGVPVLGVVMNAVDRSYYGSRYRRPIQAVEDLDDGSGTSNPESEQE